MIELKKKWNKYLLKNTNYYEQNQINTKTVK